MRATGKKAAVYAGRAKKTSGGLTKAQLLLHPAVFSSLACTVCRWKTMVSFISAWKAPPFGETFLLTGVYAAGAARTSW